MVKKLFYTKELGIEVAKSARPLHPSKYHVIIGVLKGWTVVREGSIRGKAFITQTQAVEFAKKTAKKANGEVIIHSKSGQIGDLISFKKSHQL